MKKATVIVLVSVLVFGAAFGVVAVLTWSGGEEARGLTRFTSSEQFIAALREGLESGGYDGGVLYDMAVPTAEEVTGSSSKAAPEHSTTNVQVEGVDEADVVKTDGDYVYVISGSRVFIAAAYPAHEARVLSSIDYGSEAKPAELFLSGERLVVVGNTYGMPEGVENAEDEIPYHSGSYTFIEVFDISEPEKPALNRTVEYEGGYSTARMIGDNVHVVLTTHPDYILYDKPGLKPEDAIPVYSDTPGKEEPGEPKPAVDFQEIDVIDPERFTSFLSIVSFSVEGGEADLDRRVIAGHSDTVYASQDNLYVASARYMTFGGPVPLEGEYPEETTTVYKFALEGAGADYLGFAEVPGTVLNQFSMDEHNGYFRIATTRGHVSREGGASTNNVYILDPQMKQAGSLEGLAEGERIYSVRFMGDRAYMVTFKKVDPLFVLDLADPLAPRVLGELKIPGYSDYLHPYDENHIIGVGKNTVEAAPEEGVFAWYQGMKIAIFDVTDVANPVEMHKVEIGDRGTDSCALHDHKAFLFDRDRNLLVLPVSLAELTPEQKASPETEDYDCGEQTFQGAYVYDVTLDGGFHLEGRITHEASGGESEDPYYGYHTGGDAVTRALYLEDSLYTFSEARIKANRLPDLAEVANVELRPVGQ